MTFSVTMPALGESVSEGTVTRWLKSEGDHVAMDEPLLEVSTDKVDTEIPSPVAGILQKIVVAIDQTVPVGAELAIIADGGAPASTPAPAAPVAAAPVTPPASEIQSQLMKLFLKFQLTKLIPKFLHLLPEQFFQSMFLLIQLFQLAHV